MSVNLKCLIEDSYTIKLGISDGLERLLLIELALNKTLNLIR